jgi:hypothetical protein
VTGSGPSTSLPSLTSWSRKLRYPSGNAAVPSRLAVEPANTTKPSSDSHAVACTPTELISKMGLSPSTPGPAVLDRPAAGRNRSKPRVGRTVRSCSIKNAKPDAGCGFRFRAAAFEELCNQLQRILAASLQQRRQLLASIEHSSLHSAARDVQDVCGFIDRFLMIVYKVNDAAVSWR